MGAGKATHYHGTSRDLVKYKPSAFRVWSSKTNA